MGDHRPDGLQPAADPLGIFAPDLFRGRTALVTGGGTGIGLEIALAFARFGANLVIASRKPDNLEAAARRITSLGVECLPVPTNIRELDQVDALVEQVDKRLGTPDFLINNAGGQFPARPTEISDQGWRSVVDLNLNGTWNLCSRFGPRMLDRGAGVIVNIVHIYSLDRGAQDFAHSGAARAGVVNLTKSLAFHWARHGVRVNALAPGTISTVGLRKEEYSRAEDENIEAVQVSEIPTQRLGEANEVAAITLFLCSDAARYINGTTLVADGAYSVANWTPMRDPSSL